MPPKILGLIDGENIVLRYQSLVKQGKVPCSEVVHIEDQFVWHPGITRQFYCDPVRFSYYQTIYGDLEKIKNITQIISTTKYTHPYEENFCDGSGTLHPRIFKKERRNQKSKSVDINICTDALRHTYNKSCNVVYLLSGDGDYLPLVEEIMRQGNLVWLAAFSDGLSQELKYAVDDFIDLDLIFFAEPKN